MKTVRFRFDHAPGNSPVTLTVKIGDGQVGGSVVRLNGKQIGNVGTIRDLPIGDGPALVGQELTVRTGVLDINDAANSTTVTYDLNGAAPGALMASAEVEHDDDAVVYETVIRFV